MIARSRPPNYNNYVLIRSIPILLLACCALAADTPPVELDIAGNDLWVDTKVDVHARDEVVITGTGKLTLTDGQQTTPDGARRGFRDMLRTYPVNAAGQGALIGRLGDSETAQPFLIGPTLKWQAPRDGRLWIGINRSGSAAPKGSFHVKIEFSSHAPEATSKVDYKLPAITTEIADRFPRRIGDAQGNAGDNTNFLLVGTEAKILEAFKAAGWVEVDRSQNDAVLNGILAIIDKRAYVALPMSELMLFGRVQDHGMAHGDPISVVAQRHHFRIWKAPFQVEGQEIWIGAGTHDIGFDRDQRKKNGITHKIDPDVDKEREYIGMSLQETGLIAQVSYVTPSKPSKEAVTATGASFHSDGRLLVIHLIPDSSTPAAAPATAPAPEKKGTSIFDEVREP